MVCAASIDFPHFWVRFYIFHSVTALAFALGKVLQHNKTLQTLFWDDNLTTMAGLKMFKIGLGRNYSLRYMPLPVLDMANILKTEPDLNAVVQISTAIQQHVFENAAAAYPASSANTPKPGHGSQPSPGTTAVKPKRTSSYVLPSSTICFVDFLNLTPYPAKRSDQPRDATQLQPMSSNLWMSLVHQSYLDRPLYAPGWLQILVSFQ